MSEIEDKIDEILEKYRDNPMPDMLDLEDELWELVEIVRKESEEE